MGDTNIDAPAIDIPVIDIPAMDYTEHNKTYHMFLTLTKYGTVACIIILALMAFFLL